MSGAHPACDDGHICQEPSGRVCIEQGCAESAGTLWGPYWCPDHDRDRINCVSRGFEQIAAAFAEPSNQQEDSDA